MYPEKVAGLVITGSSGLYESAMGDSYPRGIMNTSRKS
jgi:hypothetical protein